MAASLQRGGIIYDCIIACCVQSLTASTLFCFGVLYLIVISFVHKCIVCLVGRNNRHRLLNIEQQFGMQSNDDSSVERLQQRSTLQHNKILVVRCYSPTCRQRSEQNNGAPATRLCADTCDIIEHGEIGMWFMRAVYSPLWQMDESYV